MRVVVRGEMTLEAGRRRRGSICARAIASCRTAPAIAGATRCRSPVSWPSSRWAGSVARWLCDHGDAGTGRGLRPFDHAGRQPRNNMAGALVCSNSFTLNEQGESVPDLATSLDNSPDGLTSAAEAAAGCQVLQWRSLHLARRGAPFPAHPRLPAKPAFAAGLVG